MATSEKHVNLNCMQHTQIHVLLNSKYEYLKFPIRCVVMQVTVSQKFIYQLVCG
jgi:hypothetical protein